MSGIDLVVDIGSGNGRNAAWLARSGLQVVALDFSDEALRLTREVAARHGVERMVSTVRADLYDGLPLRTSTFPLAIDSYVTCHFEPLWVQKVFQSEAARVLIEGGVLFSSQFAPDDEYYAHLIAKHGWDGQSVVDPANNVRKYLYRRDQVEELFLGSFDVAHLLELHFDDVVRGSVYRRHIFSLLCIKE